MYVGGTANICHSSDVLFMDVCVLVFCSFRGVDELQIIIHYYCYRRYYHHTRQRPRSGGLSWWHLYYYRVHIILCDHTAVVSEFKGTTNYFCELIACDLNE